MLCDDAVHDAVIVAVAVFALAFAVAGVFLVLLSALDSNNIEHCSAS